MVKIPIKIREILKLIGNTPLIKISRAIQTKANVYAKLEYFNLTGSVKDRTAYGLIKDAFEKGIISTGSTIVEPTSGNTGISLSALAKFFDLKTIIVMPENMSVERYRLMRHFGAQIVLTSKDLGMKGAVEKAQEILKENPSFFMPMQFENPANPRIHYHTTAKEIWQQLKGKVDLFVCGVGTGGTLSGVGRFLKERNKDVKIFAVEPKRSAVLSGQAPSSHNIAGIGAGFIPKVLDLNLIDEIILVDDDEAVWFSKLIAEKEGFPVGISSGAALCAVAKIADRFKGKNIVTIFPDGVDRYISTGFF